MAMEAPTSAAKLLLDTHLDRAVDFTALSMLPNVAGGGSTADVSSRRLPRVPVAGSKGWLPSMVEVGRQEARFRDTAIESTGGDLDGGSTSSDVFFAVDVECVLHKYRRWHDCFPRVKPFYAVKCNPNSEVVRVLAATPGCGFDCASPAEMDQVLECGVDPSRIIYANPCKDLAALEHALSAGVATMTFDSKDELYKIRRLLDSRAKVLDGGLGEASVVQLVLRLRVPDSHSDCPLGEKYGAAEEACSELISLAVELRLPLVGISFHCGSGCQNAQAYPEALAVAKSVFDLAARKGVKLTLLDIGGGFPGWDGSEYVYRRPSPDDDETAAAAAATRDSSPPSATDAAATPGGGDKSDGGNGGTASARTVSDDGGGVTGGGEDVSDGCSLPCPPRPSPPPPPLSLAEIARVTLPVLDELFPPESGVQVIAEPGRYFVEASHLLFARIYAKRSLSLLVGADASSNAGGDNTTTTTTNDGRRRKTTAYYIAEGVSGCFKDRVLCGVNFEPCPVSSPPAGYRARPGGAPQHEDHRAGQSAAPAPALAPPPAEAEGQQGGGEGEEAGNADEEYAVVMGPSGLPTDVVARKRLRSSLGPGDWLYFSQMGAYTASIATVASSAVLEASFCYVASTPAAVDV
ncbi:unnamed protein product [Ectocarpus sp. 12 AP-2014]